MLPLARGTVDKAPIAPARAFREFHLVVIELARE